MQKFNRSTQVQTPWQVLSAQSAKVTLPFIAIIIFNFVGLLLNLRIDGLAEANFNHQILFVALCGICLGSIEIVKKRQEFVTTLPIKRSQIFLNRLSYGLIFIFISCLLNYLLNSGMLEQTFYREVMMPIQATPFWLKQTGLLISTLVISYSCSIVARTFTGIMLSAAIIALFFFIPSLLEVDKENLSLIYSLFLVSIIITFFSFITYTKMDQIKQSIKNIERLNLSNYITLLCLALYTASLVFFEGGY